MSASALTSWLPGWWRTRRATDERTGAATSATRPRLRLPPPFRLVGRDPGFAGGRALRSRRAEPLAVWQHGSKLELIDREGGVIPVTRLDRFAKLPLVVGEGAARHAAELLDMLATEPELAARVSAAIRVGDRRWNLRIDNAIDVF